jgi:hypothetical protein
LKHQRIFWVCIALILWGLGWYLLGFFSIYYGSTAITPVYLSILGLDAWFVGVVINCVTEYERRIKSLLKRAILLLATDGLLYLLAAWIISPPSPTIGDYGNAWGFFGYNMISLNGGWVIGFDFLYVGISVTLLTAFVMILMACVMALLAGARAFKGWIEKLHHVNTQTNLLKC